MSGEMVRRLRKLHYSICQRFFGRHSRILPCPKNFFWTVARLAKSLYNTCFPCIYFAIFGHLLTFKIFQVWKNELTSLHFTALHCTSLRVFMALLLFMAVLGCQKEETVGKDEITTTPPPLLAKGDDGPDKHEERCNCEYQIVLASHEAPPVGYNDVAYNCFTKETWWIM